jgi:hypothetical protein
MQLPTEHTVRGDLPHPCSEESDVRLIILAVVESRANRKKPESLLVCRPTDRNSGKAAERLDERIGLFTTVVNKFRILPFESSVLQSQWTQRPLDTISAHAGQRAITTGPRLHKIIDTDTLTFYMFRMYM